MAIAPDVPRRVVLDGRHLRQVLLNLLGNAIKFTAAGRGRGSAIARRRRPAALRGAATPASASSPRRSTRSSRRSRRPSSGAAAGGTGLGLTISQHLIGSMGGELQVESALGEGSRFYFALPLVPRRRRPRPTDEDVDGRRSRRSTRGWRRARTSRRWSSTTAP